MIVTTVAASPHTGVKLVIVGAGSAVTVNGSGVASAPAPSVTTTFPVVAAGGTMTTTVPVVGVPTIVAVWALNVTLATGSVNVPVIVTCVPAGPVLGLSRVASAAEAGVTATMPSRSNAKTTTPATRDLDIRIDLIATPPLAPSPDVNRAT